MANSRGYWLPVLITVSMHLGLFIVLANDWTPRANPHPVIKPIKAVQATLVTLKKEKPKPKAVKPKLKPKPKPKAKQKPVAKPKVVKPKIKEAPKPDLEKLKREEEAREKAIEKAEKEQQRIADEQALAAMLDGEDAEMQADDDANIIAQYTAMISQQMHQRWKLPPSARRNMVALVKIRMVPTGELVTVTVAQSSGNEAFDQSAILAVKKAGRFAFMQGMPSRLFETHFREFTFRFSPEDLRL